MSTFWTVLVAILGALPKIWEMIGWFSNMWEKKPSDVVSEFYNVFKKVKKSKTREDRIDAAKSIQDLFGN